MKIIGLSGKIGSGKSTMAGELSKTLPGKWGVKSFGFLLKCEVSEALRFPLVWCYTEQGKNTVVNIDNTWSDVRLVPKLNMTVRELLQWYGTEYRRAMDPDYWVKRMDRYLADIDSRGGTDGILIDDVRFKNEADYIKSIKGTLVRIEPYAGYKLLDGVFEHISETDLDYYKDFDLTVRPPYGQIEAYSKVIKWVLEKRGIIS